MHSKIVGIQGALALMMMTMTVLVLVSNNNLSTEDSRETISTLSFMHDMAIRVFPASCPRNTRTKHGLVSKQFVGYVTSSQKTLIAPAPLAKPS